MIEIHRPTAVPPILLTSGAAERRRLCRAYARASATFESGKRLFFFDATIYGHDDVKSALCAAQQGKCAFCESQITHIAYGTIEHFRPKGGFRQRASGPLERPGYYWLAFTWDNLLFACQLCNQRHKKNQFPLLDPAQRARSHRDDVSHEQPTFIDPAAEDPALSLSFRDEVPFPKNKRGRTTIRALGLDRKPLQDKRKELLELLRLTFLVAFVLRAPRAEARSARDLLRRAVSDAGEYAAMVRAAIPGWEKEYGVQMT